jgi:hypothetical protein
MDMYLTIFQTVVVFIAALLAPLLALLYFRRVRLERPALGVFNARDILLILVFILSLPFLYLVLPSYVLTGMLALTFSSALYIALRPFLRPLYLWPLVAFLLVGDIVVTRTLMGTTQGWQVYWVFNNVIVLGAVVGISNLYVQGGMRMRQVVWFSFILACYDLFFDLVVPVSAHLADRFHGQPLDAAMGWISGSYSSNLGIGDILIFALFTISAYKGFGRKGMFASIVTICLCGALLPSLSSLMILPLVRGGIGITIPVQTFFGPFAVLTYYLLRRSGPERSMARWMSAEAAEGYEPIRVTRRRRVGVPVAAPSLAEAGTGQGD